MTTITFEKREMTYLFVALNEYKKSLHGKIDEEMGDEYDDLLMVDHLIRRLTEAEAEPGN